MAALLFVALSLLALLGAPLFTVLLAVAMVGFHLQGIDLSAVAIEIYRLADMPLLLALPFFAFAGYMIGHSQTSRRLVRLTQVFLGWLPGGAGHRLPGDLCPVHRFYRCFGRDHRGAGSPALSGPDPGRLP